MMHTETRPNPPQKRPIGTEVAGTQRYTAKLEGRCGTSMSVTERCGWTMQMGCGCAAVRSRPNRNTLEGRYAILRLRCLGGVLVLRRRAEFLRCGRRMRCARRGRLVRLLLAHTFKPKRLVAPTACADHLLLKSASALFHETRLPSANAKRHANGGSDCQLSWYP